MKFLHVAKLRMEQFNAKKVQLKLSKVHHELDRAKKELAKLTAQLPGQN